MQEEYITRREFEAFKREIEQRHTDQMKAINVNVGSQDVLDQLQELKQGQAELKRDLEIHSKAWVDSLNENVTELKGDISALRHEMATMKEDIIDAIRKYSQPGKN